jgi:hypothetical protein
VMLTIVPAVGARTFVTDTVTLPVPFERQPL